MLSASLRKSSPAALAGGGFQRQPDEGDGNILEGADLVGRKHCLVGAGEKCRRGEIVEFGAGEALWPAAALSRMTAAILHAQQFVLALVELVIADGRQSQPHLRHRFDGRLVVEHRRQERAGADEVAGRHEDRVRLAVGQQLHQARHVLGAAGRDHAGLGRVRRIGDSDAGRRRLEVAVEVVDGQDAQRHRLILGMDGQGGKASGGEGGDEAGGENAAETTHGRITCDAGRRRGAIAPPWRQ